jgi:gliding motility-associated-like protein
LFFSVYLISPIICAKPLNSLYPLQATFAPKAASIYRIYLLICALLYIISNNMRKVLLLLIVSSISITGFCQDFSNKGKEFWLAYSYHVGMVNAGGAPSMTLYITSDVATTYNVEIFGGAVIQAGTIAANQVIVVVIPNTYFANGDGIFANRAIHVTALKPIVVYSFITRSQASAATLCLPTNVLGIQYYSSSFTQNSNEPNSASYITIVAIENNTTVEIIPTNLTAGGWAAGSINNINLNKGDVYQVLGTTSGNSGVDLSGTSVRSIASGSGGCKKIAVFSGSGKLALGCAGSADNLYQQLYPVATWGKKYLTVPSNGRLSNYYRIMRYDPATNVYLNGVLVPAASFINGYYTFNNSVPNLIESDIPVSVAQYFTSQNCSGNGNPYDPDMIILNPVEQNINRVTLVNSPLTIGQNPPNQPHQHHIHVIMRNGGTGQSSFTLDGAVVPAALWTIHPQDPNYSYLYRQVSQGNHSLYSDSGFNAIAYGYGSAETYGYSAGANVKDLYQQIGVSTQYGIETTPSVCTGSPFKFKVSLPYCADSLRWDLSGLPGPPPNQIVKYTSCTPGAGGPDSTTIVNGKTIYWYSLPNTYSFSTIGIYPVTITANTSTGISVCGSEQDIDFDLQVSDPPSADFTWVASGCPAEPVSFIDITNTVKPTYKWWWDFGDPLSGATNTSALKNPVHTFSAPGTYTVRYANITTPGCLSDTVSRQVVVPKFPTATISGAATVCINDPVQPTILFTAAEGKAPYTFTYNIDAGGGPGPNLTVSSVGTGNTATVLAPTNIAGTFTYNLVNVANTSFAACNQNITGQQTAVTITPDATINLSSAAGTDNQNICINTPAANITYAAGGSGTGGSVTGLPAGVTGSFAAGVITITGTPTVSGVFNYTVSTTGPCVKPTATGTLTVTEDATLALTSATATSNQTICINTPLTNITYAVGGSGTGGTVSGLPAGVTGTFTGGVITITGTPTVNGTFNYTVNTTGPCVKPTASGTITVTADATVALISAAGTDNQTICINTPLTGITYAVGGTGTGGSVTGLPAGVTGSFAAGVISITGTPTVSGVFNYTVNTTGPCVKPTATGTITVTANATITLVSAPATTNQALCLNATIANITYAVGGTGTGGSVTGLPAGVTGTYTGGVITITGTPTVSGVFNYTVNTAGPCVQPTAAGTITVYALPTLNFTNTAPSCETRVITFTDNSNPNVGTLTNWLWNFGDVNSTVANPNTSTATNPTHTFSAAGNYTVGLTVITSNGCTNPTPFTKIITISDRPKAGFIVPEVCINDIAAVFTDTSKIASGTIDPAGYQWDFGDPASGAANTSTTQNGTHLYSLTGSYTVRHIVTSALGCKDTTFNNIFINGADPVANFSVTNAGALCANDSVAIVNLSTIGQGSITKVEIYWDFAGAPAVVETDDFPAPNKVYKHKYPNFQAPLTIPYTIRFRAYSGTLCQDVKSIPITVNAAPKVQFNAMPDACLDATPFQVTQASEIGGVPGTAVYAGPGINATGLFNPALAGVGTHRIKYTFTSAAAGCVDTISRLIKVLDTATAKFSLVTPVVCQGNAVTFKEESTAPAGVVLTSTVFDFGDGTTGTYAPGSTVTHTYAAWGTYTVKMYNVSAYGCKSTVSTKQIYISPNPVPLFSFDQNSVCLPNALVSVKNNSTIADNTALTYLWDFGDGSGTSTALAPTHVYRGTGPYTVTLTVKSVSNCTNTLPEAVNFIHPQPKAAFDFSKPEVCVGQDVIFNDLTDGLDGTVVKWNWDFGDLTTGNTRQAPHLYATAKTYDVSLYIVNSQGCNSDTLTKPFTVHPYPVVDAGPDRVVLEGGSITLQPVVTGNDLQYLWSPPTYLNNVNIAAPTAVNVQDDITYTLVVTGRGGCTAPPDKMFVKVLKAPQVPNTFTPNNDGINDFWKIEYLDTYPNNRVQVFTRTGQLVFESKGYKTPWNGTLNGKPLPVDTYYYIIEPENGRKPMTGYVTILK